MCVKTVINVRLKKLIARLKKLIKEINHLTALVTAQHRQPKGVPCQLSPGKAI